MRCDSCPVPADRPCLGETPRFAHFCAWAEGGEATQLVHIVNRSAIAETAPPMPPLMTQARNLAGAVVRFVVSGGEQTTPEQAAERMAICRGCEEFAGGRCRICGCHLAYKVASAVEHCPLDPPRW